MTWLARIRASARRGGIDRMLQAAALVMLPGGFAAILLGWYGAARTPLVFEQIPYLISGGLLGTGLVFGGGLLYLTSWLSRLAAQQRDDAAMLRDLLARLPAQLAPSGRAPDVYLMTPTGTMFHRPECSVVAGRDDVREVRGDEPGLHPCKLCRPGGDRVTSPSRP